MLVFIFIFLTILTHGKLLGFCYLFFFLLLWSQKRLCPYNAVIGTSNFCYMPHADSLRMKRLMSLFVSC